MKATFKWTTASGAMAMALVGHGTARAEPTPLPAGNPVVEISSPVNMSVSAWTRDRTAPQSFTNVNWQGRTNVIKLGITPPPQSQSFNNWQGYFQPLTTPAGPASIKSDLWVNANWESGSQTNYVRTGIWGSVLPAGTGSYVDAQAIFPIISFTNENGAARLQVWDTTTNPAGGWVDLDASVSALSLNSWNNFEMRVLPGSDRIDYLVNGTTVYSWSAPRADNGNMSDELWAVYLEARNNGATSYDTYWSNIAQAQLILDGEIITSAPTGFNILADAAGTVSVADAVVVGGSVTVGARSAATLSFGIDSGVRTTANNMAGIISNAGGSVIVDNGFVSTSGANAHGLNAVGIGSAITTNQTTITVAGSNARGALATLGGAITLNGGSLITTGSRAYGLMAADSSSLITSSADITTNAEWTFGAFARDNAIINLTGGTITTNGMRAHGLFTERGGSIVSAANIVTNGDLAHGVQAGSTQIGASTITLTGGTVTTTGAAAYGLLAYNGSSITGNVAISTSGDGSFGASADGDGVITLNSGSVTTTGMGAHGLQAVYDDRFVHAGTLAANVDVTTSGASAFGVLASDLGQVTLSGGTIQTSGASAHGLLTIGVRNAIDSVSQITASNIHVKTMAADAAAVAMFGTGTINLSSSSVESAGNTIAIAAQSGSRATINASGSTLTSGSSTLLLVDRSLDDGSGIVSLKLSGGSVATGNIVDIGAKTSGYTDVSLSNATLKGAVAGVRRLSLSDGAVWSATGPGSVAMLSIGTGGGTLDTGANIIGISAALTGTGTLVKSGSGTLALSGNGSDFIGTTRIDTGTVLLTGSLASAVDIRNGGTLQIGDGGTSGDLTGATNNNGLLIFARSDDYDYRGALSGNGGLIKRGNGLLMLSGAYSYTGSTIIEGGQVKLASALNPNTDLVIDHGTLDLSDKVQEVAGLSGSSGTLALGETGALTVAQTDNSVFAGNITGSGSFTKTGAGTLNLTGASSFSGQAVVNEGRLAVNGSLQGDITVNGGGTLGGNGVIQSVAIQQGGVVAPGNSIGTLRVTGDVTFGTGSVYAVELDADGNNDKIITSGRAHLTGGAVSVIAAAGNYRWFTDYTILTAAAGIDGRFAEADVDLPFLDPTLSYRATDVVLTLQRNDRSFVSAAGTANQVAVATAIDSMSATADVARAVAGQTSAASARAAFDALSGELWSSTSTALIDHERSTGALVLGRLQQADSVTRRLAQVGGPVSQTRDGRTAIWGQFLGSWNRIGSDGNAAGVRQSTVGFVTGLDHAIGDWRIGAAFGHSEVKVDLAARASSSTTLTNSASLYAGGGWNNLRVHLGGGYSWHDIDGKRMVAFSSFSGDVTGAYRGNSASAFGEISYAASLGHTQVEPFAGVNYVHLKTDAFREAGGSTAMLSVGKSKRDVAFTTLGLRLRTDRQLSDTVTLSPHLSAAWQRAFGDRKAWGSRAFDDGDAYRIAGLPLVRNAVQINAGIEAGMRPGGTIGVSYVGNMASRWNDHGVRISFSPQLLIFMPGQARRQSMG